MNTTLAEHEKEYFRALCEASANHAAICVTLLEIVNLAESQLPPTDVTFISKWADDRLRAYAEAKNRLDGEIKPLSLRAQAGQEEQFKRERAEARKKWASIVRESLV